MGATYKDPETGFRYLGEELAEAVASGEWSEASKEILKALEGEESPHAEATGAAADDPDTPPSPPCARRQRACSSARPRVWMRAFAARLFAESRHPFYRAAAAYLGAPLLVKRSRAAKLNPMLKYPNPVGE